MAAGLGDDHGRRVAARHFPRPQFDDVGGRRVRGRNRGAELHAHRRPGGFLAGLGRPEAWSRSRAFRHGLRPAAGLRGWCPPPRTRLGSACSSSSGSVPDRLRRSRPGAALVPGPGERDLALEAVLVGDRQDGAAGGVADVAERSLVRARGHARVGLRLGGQHDQVRALGSVGLDGEARPRRGHLDAARARSEQPHRHLAQFALRAAHAPVFLARAGRSARCSPGATFSPASARPLAGTITGGPGRNAAPSLPTAGQASVPIASSARKGWKRPSAWKA